MKMKEARALLGKRVEWEESHDRHRGTCLVRTGTIEKIVMRNVLINGDWKWLPDLVRLKEI